MKPKREPTPTLKREKPPVLYIVFSGRFPQFFVYTPEIAQRWIGRNEFTHYEKYVPATARMK